MEKEDVVECCAYLKWKEKQWEETMVRKLKWSINQKALTLCGKNNIMTMLKNTISNMKSNTVILWLDLPA